MKSVNFVMLGDQNMAGTFGKKGTVTDLTLYDKKESDVIRTWVVPNGFPEKIPPLLQAINLAEFVVFYVTSLDRFTGEQIVALDVLGKHKGILGHSFDIDESTLDSMIQKTAVAKYATADHDGLREAMSKLEPVSDHGKTKIVIDHCFDVKGVGTVALGKVLSGTVMQYDTLKLFPSGMEVMIKSIQMHDKPVEQAQCPARVGLSLKGIKPEDVGRGDILCADDSLYVTDMIKLDFAKTPYYKNSLAEGQMCLINIGLKTMAGKITSINGLEIKLDKNIAFDKNDTAVILKPESTGIRIAGSGKIIV